MKEKLEEYLSLLSYDFKLEIDHTSSNSIFLRIWQPISGDKFFYNNSNYFNSDEVIGDVDRTLINLRRDFTFDVLYIYTINDAGSEKYSRKVYKFDELNNINDKKIKSFCLRLNNIN